MLRQLLAASAFRAAASGSASQWLVTSAPQAEQSAQTFLLRSGCLDAWSGFGGASRAASKASKASKSAPPPPTPPPPKPPTGYQLFVKENIAVLKKEQGAISKPNEAMAETGRKWSALSDEEKKVFIDKALLDPKHKSWSEYQEKNKAGKEAGKKNAQSGYSLYMSEAVPLYHAKSGGKATDALSLAAKGWKELTADQQQAYKDAAAKLKQEA